MLRRKFISCLPFISGCVSAEMNFIAKKNYFDSGEIIKNPRMGNIIYYYANSLKYYKDDIDGYKENFLNSIYWASIMCLRLPWSEIEKKNGEYDWSVIDEPMKKYKKYGFRFVIRITTSENDPKIKFATPQWVFELGAKYNRFTGTHPGKFDKNGSNFEPVFGDDIFIFYLKRFLIEMAVRYDGNKDIDFIDMGSLGVYGEGHTVSSTQVGYGRDVLLEHFNMHIDIFKKTKIIVNHNFADRNPKEGRDLEVMKMISRYNVGFRDDSILIGRGARAYYDNDMAQLFGKKNPVVLEMGEYSSRVASGAWDRERLINAIFAYKASYFGIYWYPKSFYEKEKELLDDICRKIGYRILVEELCLYKKNNNIFILIFKVKNVGSSFLYFDVKINVYVKMCGTKTLIGSSVIVGGEIPPNGFLFVDIDCDGVFHLNGRLFFEFVDDAGVNIKLPHVESGPDGVEVEF
jgi:hypothetical protein